MGNCVVVVECAFDVVLLEFVKTVCDGGGVCVLVEGIAGVEAVEAVNSAKDLSFACGNAMCLGVWERCVDGGSVLDDGSDECVVGVEKSAGMAPLEVSHEMAEEVGSVADFLERVLEVGVE